MEEMDRNYPRLIGCLGLLDTSDKECNRCNYAYDCYIIQRELEGKEFREGRYRPGFGRPKLPRKYVRWL